MVSNQMIKGRRKRRKELPLKFGSDKRYKVKNNRNSINYPPTKKINPKKTTKPHLSPKSLKTNLIRLK